MHGPHRRPVGVAGTAVSSQTTERWARPTVARYAGGAERCLLGFTHRRSLARSASSLSALSDLSSPLPTVAAFGLLTMLLQKLAEDLRDRGKLDLSESFIDASFSSAKKGALVSALQNAAKAAKSWQSQTAMVFLSPCTWPALRRMKQSSSNPRSNADSSRETSRATDRRPRLRQRSAGPARFASASAWS